MFVVQEAFVVFIGEWGRELMSAASFEGASKKDILGRFRPLAIEVVVRIVPRNLGS